MKSAYTFLISPNSLTDTSDKDVFHFFQDRRRAVHIGQLGKLHYV